MLTTSLLKKLAVQQVKVKINDMWAVGPIAAASACMFPWLILLLLLRFAKEFVKWTTNRYLSKEQILLEKFAGPIAYPIIGTIPDMIFADFYEWSGRICKRWGDPVRLWRFRHPMIFISSYKYAVVSKPIDYRGQRVFEQLLSNSNFNGKLHDLDMIRRQPGGKGLSTTPAALHAQTRKMLLPAFSRHIVEASIPIFCEESVKLVNKLEVFANSGKMFDVVEHAMCSLFRMVARSDFGDNFINNNDKDDKEAKRHMDALHTIAKNMSERILRPKLWNRNDFAYFHLTVQGNQTRMARDVINSYAKQAIRKRRGYLAGKIKIIVGDSDEQFSNSQTCYLDILLELMDKGQMTEEDVISELNNFMGGAYDTTALAVCWTLLLLALHPHHQQCCYEELNEIFLQSFRGPQSFLTPQQTKCMKYLELCLKESLRMFPPAPIFPRSTVNDIQLEDGRVIPGGVDVLIFANLIHRDPTHFPQPNEFIPERHLEGSSPAYMPFSLGVRNCIGQTYGMYQAKVVLAYLLMAYEWQAPETLKRADDVKIAYQGLLYPAEGIKLKISKRSPT